MNYGVLIQNPKTDGFLGFYIYDAQDMILQAWEHPLKQLYQVFSLRKLVPRTEDELGSVAALLMMYAHLVEVDIMQVDTFGFVSDEWLRAEVREPKRKLIDP
jgi:hypothetical protein